MTTSLDTLVVPVRYYTALDPYNWKVDNRPISDLEDNDDVLRSGVETALNAVKTGAAIDGRILRSLVGLDKASGDWTLHPSAVTITLTDLIKGSVVSDDGFNVGVIAAQYSPAVFALATPAVGRRRADRRRRSRSRASSSKRTTRRAAPTRRCNRRPTSRAALRRSRGSAVCGTSDSCTGTGHPATPHSTQRWSCRHRPRRGGGGS